MKMVTLEGKNGIKIKANGLVLGRLPLGVKKHVFLWTTPKMREMTAIDWQHYPNAREIDHLRYLEIMKPVRNGEVKLLIGNDHYEELLVPLKHHTVKPDEE